MRIAAIYDVHGNLPALEAVCAEIGRAGAELLIVGGDIMPGPMARECLTYLLDLALPVRFIHGNGESAVLAYRAGSHLGHVPEQARAAISWVAGQIDEEQARLIASWPLTLSVEIAGVGETMFCHATPRSDTETFTRVTPEARLRPMFEGLEAALVVCGHTHMPFDRMIGEVRVVNAGSVGMPFGQPGADWLLVGPDVEHRHTEYDLAGAAESVKGTDYPGAAEFALGNILSPPSEDEMLRIFSGADST